MAPTTWAVADLGADQPTRLLEAVRADDSTGAIICSNRDVSANTTTPTARGDVATLLAAVADAHAALPSGETVLMTVSRIRSVEAVRFLASQGPVCTPGAIRGADGADLERTYPD